MSKLSKTQIAQFKDDADDLACVLPCGCEIFFDHNVNIWRVFTIQDQCTEHFPGFPFEAHNTSPRGEVIAAGYAMAWRDLKAAGRV